MEKLIRDFVCGGLIGAGLALLAILILPVNLDDWEFYLLPFMILFGALVLAILINSIIEFKKYPYDPNAVYLDGREILPIEEEQRRQKEWEWRAAWLLLAIALPALLIWFICCMILW